jgi:hypothetical protein
MLHDQIAIEYDASQINYYSFLKILAKFSKFTFEKMRLIAVLHVPNGEGAFL